MGYESGNMPVEIRYFKPFPPLAESLAEADLNPTVRGNSSQIRVIPHNS